MGMVPLKEAARLANRSKRHIQRLAVSGEIKGKLVTGIYGPAWEIEVESLYSYFAPNLPRSTGKEQELRELRKEVAALVDAVKALQDRLPEM